MGDRERDIAWTINAEGGDKFTNYPWDPGGPTKYGIAQRSHPGVDIEHLTLEQAVTIYSTDYWNKVAGDTRQEPLALNLNDAAVNLGPVVALHLLTVPPLVLPSGTNDYLWARIQQYADITAANLRRASAKQYPSETAKMTAMRDEYAKFYGWLRRCLNIRKESATR